jgi:GNAT superfamily N-acetyltransferase
MTTHSTDDPEKPSGPALIVQDDPAAGDLAWVDDRLYDFNVAATGYDDGRYLAIFLRRESGEIYAGLHGHTWGGCCEIKALWIAERERGAGLGARLLAAAEQEARRRGCAQINLSSHSFQAPAFYEKYGFVRVAALTGLPAGHANILLMKRLTL